MRLLAPLSLLLLAAAVQAQGTAAGPGAHVTALRAGIAVDSVHLAEGNATAALRTLPYRVAVADSLDAALAEVGAVLDALQARAAEAEAETAAALQRAFAAEDARRAAEADRDAALATVAALRAEVADHRSALARRLLALLEPYR